MTAADRRPVLIALSIVEELGLADRARPVDARLVVVDLSEDELLGLGRAHRLDWNEPDADGYYTPTLYSTTDYPLHPRVVE